MMKLIISFSLTVSWFVTYSQTIPLGIAGIEEYLRREQLLNNYDSSISFTSRPLTPLSDNIRIDESNFFFTVNTGFEGLKMAISAPQIHLEWNSHHPYTSNNGAITPAKGLQSSTSLGVNLSTKWLSIQFRPEILASENLEYDGFSDTLSNRLWDIRYEWWNRIDNPENFGSGGKFKLLPGQSHLIFHVKNIGIGLSTENLWWGPGKKQSLLMSNNARGFTHFTLRTMKPLPSPIGFFEGQVIAGRLNGSDFAPPSQSGTGLDARFSPRIDDWRYLSGFVFTYQPKWVRGLSIGWTRVIQQYYETAKSYDGGFLPIVRNIFRVNDDESVPEADIDQLTSLFFRWLWQKERAELYFEYGRNDASLNIRDFLLSPRHSRAFIFGISKIFDVNFTDKMFEINYEHTQLEQTSNFVVRDAGSWYLHSSVRHGYTNKGEVMGAGIGPGSNMDHFGLSVIDGIIKYGVRFERIARNNDFFYRAFDVNDDWRRFWVDYTIGLEGSVKWKNFLFDGSALFTRSLNYQWELFNNPNNVPYFVNGRDVSNLHFSLKTIYLFN